MNDRDVRVLFYRSGDTWIAQCIEYDIAAFASTIEALPRAFERAVAANACANRDLGRQGLDGIESAPAPFRELAERSPFRLEPRRGKFAIKRGLPVTVREVVFAERAPPKAA